MICLEAGIKSYGRKIMNDMDKRSALAVALSFIVLALWWSAISKKQNAAGVIAPQAASVERSEEKGPAASASVDAQRPAERPAPGESEEKLRDEELLEISNSSLRCLIGKESGDIRHLFIREKNGEVDLIKEGETKPFRFYAAGA
ncbi:MAG: hypothetical protein COZ15_01500, partial [Elusimicrobia bacterium CG_4_10_14_3_um_filter_49_12_50_7]